MFRVSTSCQPVLYSFLNNCYFPEIKAAIEANMQALLVDRPGNAPLSEADLQAFTMIKSLDEVNLVK